MLPIELPRPAFIRKGTDNYEAKRVWKAHQKCKARAKGSSSESSSSELTRSICNRQLRAKTNLSAIKEDTNANKQWTPDSPVRTSPAFRSSPYLIKLVCEPMLSILSLGPDFIQLSPGLNFTKLVWVHIISISSLGMDFITAVPIMGPGPNFIHFLLPFCVRILFIQSGSKSYPFFSPCSDFLHKFGSASGYYQHPSLMTFVIHYCIHG